jgi:trans-2,3-dihydro-3-hydroxyanthranilate isomerase
VEIHVVDSCLRNGHGGSPTGVVLDDAFASDTERMGVVSELGVSHVGFVAPRTMSDGATPVRFFTATGELQGCGHGTVAVHAVLHNGDPGVEVTRQQFTGGRTFPVRSVLTTNGVMSWFDQGPVALTPATTDDALSEILVALGLSVDDVGELTKPVIASPGAPRLLLPVRTDPTLWAIRPDLARLTDACRTHGLLGCFVYSPVSVAENSGAANSGAENSGAENSGATTSARMFAPAIGVPEDIANANSTGCLAAHLAASRVARRVSVDQGDAFGRPSTILSEAYPTLDGWTTSVGGVAIMRQAT